MDNTILASVIGVIGLIVGSLITAYAKEIKVFFTKNNPNDDISGLWNGTWDHSLSENEEILEPTIDIIKLKKIGDSLYGKGSAPSIGEYKIFGNLSAHVVNLLLSGVGEEANLKGVALLKMAPVNDRMKGFWWQYSRNGNLIGGNVTLVKKK
jgi:hypothetical protein